MSGVSWTGIFFETQMFHTFLSLRRMSDPNNSPTMNSRLVQQDRSSVTEPQKPKHVKPKKWCTPNKKLSYVILGIQSSTRSLQLSWFQLPRETTHKKTDSHGNFKTQAT